MSHLERPGPELRPTSTRRGLLLAALGLGALGVTVLSGCTPSDPRIRSDGRQPSLSPRTPTATPSSTPQPNLVGPELALANLAAGILRGPHSSDVDANLERLLSAVRDAHLQHVTALRGPQPSSRPVAPAVSASPTPPPAGLTLDQSVQLLARQEQGQASRLHQTAVVESGFNALLLGSMSVAARSFSKALGATDGAPTKVSRGPHRPTAAVSDVEALQSMVRQLHAIVYGYQLALGQLSQASPAGKRALASLLRHRQLRDRLEGVLIERSAAVPAAAGAYVPPVEPTTPARSATLIRRMETALMPFCGLWLASATRASDRALALATLVSTADTARLWGAPVTAWPGWQE